jgi:hypothetical protein
MIATIAAAERELAISRERTWTALQRSAGLPLPTALDKVRIISPLMGTLMDQSAGQSSFGAAPPSSGAAADDDDFIDGSV